MEHTCCNLCGQDDTKLLFIAPDNEYQTGVKANIVKCRKCGFVYANPRLNSTEIANHYPSETYYSYQATFAKKDLRSRLKKAARQSVSGYDNNLGFFEWLFCKIVGRLLLIQLDIMVPYKEHGKILDIGCGNGEMIGWMRDYGWETYGTEISAQACEAARHQGLQTYCGQLEDAGYEDGFFDAVTINHVIEHLYDPLAVMKECRRILKDDGLMIVDCPNYDCYDRMLFNENWNGIEAPRHINHFTKDALEKLLTDAGFDISKWKFKLPIPLLDKRSLYYFKRSKKGTGYGVMLMRATLIKAVSYVFSTNRGPKFSWNITAYAVKRR